MTDWSKLSDNEVAEAYAETVRVVNETKEHLKLYEGVLKSAEFEFLMRFDKKFKEQHKFLVG